MAIAKATDHQFIKVDMDGKSITGACEMANYKNWLEGFSPAGFKVYAGSHGPVFTGIPVSLVVTEGTSELFSKYLSRGYKKINVTIVHGGANKASKFYEVQRVVYEDCTISCIFFTPSEDGTVYLDFEFTFEESAEITLNVSDASGENIKKVGPIKYSIPTQNIV